MTLTQEKPIHPSQRSGTPALSHGFSLIEVMVAVTLMSVIVLGLMAMFGETQRAFRTGITQVDVMESGRAALEMMAREIEQAAATDYPNAVNFNVGPNPYNLAPAALQPYTLLQNLPGTTAKRVNILQDVLFLNHEGQRWTAIGYAVVYTNYIGTLYRYETNASAVVPGFQFIGSVGYDTFFKGNAVAVNPSRVIDGVVDLRVKTYDSLGRVISPNYDYLTNYPSVPTLNPNLVQTTWGGRGGDINCTYLGPALPAYVEVELAILEAKTAERARAIGENSLTAQYNYLTNQVGRVQVFRQRIPIRNVDPSVYQ